MKMLTLKILSVFLCLLYISLGSGCTSGGGSTTTVTIIADANCPKDDLTVEIVKIINNGQSGTYHNIEVEYSVKCSGEGIEASLYLQLNGFKKKVGQTDSTGVGSQTFAPTSDPTGMTVTAEVYASGTDDDPVTHSEEVPAHKP
ncbi:hypothetical protein ACFLSH_03995 [Bacteroidota bacterium]